MTKQKAMYLVEYDDELTDDGEVKREIIGIFGVKDVNQFTDAESLTVDEAAKQCSICPCDLKMEATD